MKAEHAGILEGYFTDRRLSPDDIARIEHLIENDIEAATYFARLSMLEGVLHEWGGAQSAGAAPVRRIDRVRTAGRGTRTAWVWASVAACLAIVVGSVWYNGRQQRHFADVLEARVREIHGEAKIHRSGRVIVASIGMEILAGDRVETGPGGEMTLAYRDERTTVTAGNRSATYPTRVTIGDGGEGKRLHLEEGDIGCDAAPQPEGKPMAVTSPHARALVKGTRFGLFVRPRSTTLHVLEGAVVLERVPRKEGVEVVAGEFAVAGEHFSTAAKPVGEPGSLRDVLYRALRATCMEDMRALHKDVDALYRGELKRGDDCDLYRMICLGIASGITGYPRADRQGEDLGFMLGRAVEAARGEGAGVAPELSVEDRRVVLEAYTAARDAANGLLYSRWRENLHRITSSFKTADNPEKVRITDLIAFEWFYVWFYERGLAAAVHQGLSKWLDSAHPIDDLPCAAYLASVLRPMTEEEAKLEDSLESQLDPYEIHTRTKNRWRGIKPGAKGNTGEASACYLLCQSDPNARNAILWFKKPRFQEAVFTGQFRITGVGDGKLQVGTGFTWMEGRTCAFSLADYGSMGSAFVKEGLWAWFRMHLDCQGGDRWKARLWVWFEGRQPPSVRSIDEKNLPPVTGVQDAGLIDLDFVTIAGTEHVLTSGPEEDARLCLGTNNAAVTWRALGLEILRPVGELLFEDDFEKGLGKRWIGYRGRGNVTRTLSCLSTPVVETPGGPSTVLQIDCGGVVDVLSLAGLDRSFGHDAVVVEADVRIAETYGSSKAVRWTLLPFIPSEGGWDARTLFRDEKVTRSARLSEGAWFHYRREFVRRETEAGPVVDMKSFINGKCNSQLQIPGGGKNIAAYSFLFRAENCRVMIDNVVVRKLEKK